jgi:hypothetical protein
MPVQGPVCGVLQAAAALADANKVPLVVQVDNSTMDARAHASGQSYSQLSLDCLMAQYCSLVCGVQHPAMLVVSC